MYSTGLLIKKLVTGAMATIAGENIMPEQAGAYWADWNQNNRNATSIIYR
jgi:hypothetical protein